LDNCELVGASSKEFTIALERMVLKKNLPATAAITLDFTILQGIHNCPRADGIKKKLARYSSNYPRLHNPARNSQMPQSGWYLKKTCPLQQELPSTSQSFKEFTNAQERMVLKKNLPAAAAIILEFTILQGTHKCPRANGIKKTCPLQQQLSSTSQSSKELTNAPERMVLKKNLPATAAITLDFTLLPGIHNCPRADGIKKKLARYNSNYPRLHNPLRNSQLSQSGWYLKKLARYSSNYPRLHNPPRNSQMPKSSCGALSPRPSGLEPQAPPA